MLQQVCPQHLAIPSPLCRKARGGQNASSHHPRFSPAAAEDSVQIAATAGSIAYWVYGDVLGQSGSGNLAVDHDTVTFTAKVAANDSSSITLDRPLPFPIRAGWMASVHSLVAPLQRSGVERLTIQFKWEKAKAHLADRGYNAFQFEGVRNCWIRNVAILNADNGANLHFVDHSLVSNLAVGVTRLRNYIRDPHQPNGHHPLTLYHGHYNLVAGAHINATYSHDITVARVTMLNVFTKCKGYNLCLGAPYACCLASKRFCNCWCGGASASQPQAVSRACRVCTAPGHSYLSHPLPRPAAPPCCPTLAPAADHHRGGPFGNLFSDIDLGCGLRPFWLQRPAGEWRKRRPRRDVLQSSHDHSVQPAAALRDGQHAAGLVAAAALQLWPAAVLYRAVQGQHLPLLWLVCAAGPAWGSDAARPLAGAQGGQGDSGAAHSRRILTAHVCLVWWALREGPLCASF
ncbi:hypothetical protein ABPG75_005236 [Micractinium tetrahymenae]